MVFEHQYQPSLYSKHCMATDSADSDGWWLKRIAQKKCLLCFVKDNESCSLDWYAHPLDLYYSCKSYTEHFLEKKNVYCVYIWTINTIQKIVLEKLILKLCCFVFYIFSSSFFNLVSEQAWRFSINGTCRNNTKESKEWHSNCRYIITHTKIK